MLTQDYASAKFKPVIDNGVRHPFVTLRLQDIEIPLLDAKRASVDPTYAGTGPLNVQPLFLDSLQHEVKTMNTGSNLLSLRVLDPSFDYLDSLIFTKIKELNFNGLTVQYGWRGRDDGFVTSTAPINLYLHEIGVEVFPNRGTMVTLTCTDLSAELFSGSHHLSFKEDDRISDVIGEAIRKILPRLEFNIDPITTPVGALKNMEGASLGRYILSLLESSAPSTGGQPLFTVTIDPPESADGRSLLRIKSYKPEAAERTYVYGRSRDGEMLSFTPSINLRAMARLAGGRATAVSIDPVTKTWIRDESTMREDRTVGPKRSVATPQTPTDNLECPMSPAAAKAIVEGSRANADQTMWEGSATVMGDVGLRPYKPIKIIVLKNDPTASGEVTHADANAIHWASSGVWTPYVVTHQIEDGVFHTLLTMYRNAGFVGEGTDGVPLDRGLFDTADLDVSGKAISRVTPLSNPDQLTGNAGVWNPI